MIHGIQRLLRLLIRPNHKNFTTSYINNKVIMLIIQKDGTIVPQEKITYSKEVIEYTRKEGDPSAVMLRGVLELMENEDN